MDDDDSSDDEADEEDYDELVYDADQSDGVDDDCTITFENLQSTSHSGDDNTRLCNNPFCGKRH